jgi:hypothetical protein
MCHTFPKRERKAMPVDIFSWADAKKGGPIKLNGAFHTNSSIMQFVVASAAEEELGALFHNCQTGMIF